MEISSITECMAGMALAACLIAGCATITTGTDQGIKLITEKDISGASCTLVDSKGNRSYIPRTPGTTYITRGNAPLTITCSKQGYKTTSLEIGEEVSGATFGNIILGGGIGIIFDASSGAAQRYSDKVIIWMEPEVWQDEDSRLRWEEERRIFIEESMSARQKNNNTWGNEGLE
jgi:hypothetical protein